MDLQECLLQRRTIHDYKPEPVNEEFIEQALVAALHAPNHKNTQPWRFYRIGSETRKKIADLSVQLKQAKSSEPLSPAIQESQRNKMLSPYALLVIARKEHDDPTVAREDYAAIACGVQNFCLSLWARGVGSKWSTGGVTRHPSLYEWLGIDSEKEKIEGFLWVGVPQRVPPRPPKINLAEALKNIP